MGVLPILALLSGSTLGPPDVWKLPFDTVGVKFLRVVQKMRSFDC